MSQRAAPLSGIPLTALGVAMIRARESVREDRLYDDPYAAAFAAEARAALLDPDAAPQAAEQWAQLEQLVRQFYEGRTVAIRAVDDRVRGWADAGGRQLVLIGAGLDTRAYRMGLPAGLRWFELDLPEIFDFKEPVLHNVDAAPTCIRRTVAIDLRTDWAAALLAAEYDPEVPTAWVDEGAIPFLPQENAIEVAMTITRLSAPGAELHTVYARADETHQRYRDLKKLTATGADKQPPRRGLGPGAQDWLEDNGWQTGFSSWDGIAERYGRVAAITGDPNNGLIRAVRA